MDARWPEVEVEEGLDLSPFDEGALVAFVDQVLQALFTLEGKKLRLSVYFCSDTVMCDLHEKWLGDSSSTDVMSFPLQGETHDPETDRSAEGELVVCIDHARAQAGYTAIPSTTKWLSLVHGALHLLGYDDHDPVDLARMKESEARALAQLELRVEGRH